MTAPAVEAPTGTHAEVWALIERAQAGDAQAFGQIYERYADAIFRFLYYRTNNRILSEDLAGETWLRALKRIGSFTWQGRDFGAWVVTIARNLLADHYKSGWYRFSIPTGSITDADREDRDPMVDPEQSAIASLDADQIRKALSLLNEYQRLCLELRFVRGLSVAETAELMGIQEGAAKALQYRAVRALARQMPEGFDPLGREVVGPPPSLRRRPEERS